ncbi:Uncharacterised protein [Vibrio cholerae]|nr:Uncharacterised protein [Vibrio cholerae]
MTIHTTDSRIIKTAICACTWLDRHTPCTTVALPCAWGHFHHLVECRVGRLGSKQYCAG